MIKEDYTIAQDYQGTYSYQHQTIISLFEAQVERSPDNIAIVFEEKSLSYSSLNQLANQFGDYLRIGYDVKGDDLIGVMLERSEYLIIVLLGVLKAGGAYVPVDPDYPENRINYIINDSKCKVIIDDQKLNYFIRNASKYKTNNPDSIIRPENLAYVIYTSGSTGEPKGVMIEHRNVVSLLLTGIRFNFCSTDIWTLFHSYCFDFSVWEMYGALCYGGKLIIFSSLTAKDPNSFWEVVINERVTILNQTPSNFNNLMEVSYRRELSSLRYVIFGGEALNPRKLAAWNEKNPGVKLVNMYGITETTVHVTYKEITKKEIEAGLSNIGKPIPTLVCYILDPYQMLLPIGVPGELYISGEGVARGYLNLPELTAEMFVSNPFRIGGKMYKTGDYGRWLSDGNIEFIGRKDDQVKIRGYRIELGEIEHTLKSYNGVNNAVVLVKGENELEKELAAYIVSSEPINNSYLRAWLVKKLPLHLIPETYMQLDQLPLTANGKIDKKALLAIEKQEMDAGLEYIAPSNSIEERLVSVWQEVLDVDTISIRHNFFELGGNSFKAIRVVALLNNNISVLDVYQNQTIEGLAAYIKKNKNVKILQSLNSDKGLKKKSIIVVPFAGGESISYENLAKELALLANDYAFYCVSIPRVELSKNVRFEERFTTLVDNILEEISKEIDTPIIIYSKCVGTGLAIELARRLEENNHTLQALCIGGTLARKKVQSLKFDKESDISILNSFKKIGATIPDENLSKSIFCSNIRYDRTIGVFAFNHLIKNFKDKSYKKLSAPLYCIIGDLDPMTKKYKRKYKDWSLYADNVELITIEDAGHYFSRDKPKELAYILDQISLSSDFSS